MTKYKTQSRMKAVKHRLIDADLTLQDIATRIGISLQMVSKTLRGDRRSRTVEAAIAHLWPDIVAEYPWEETHAEMRLERFMNNEPKFPEEGEGGVEQC
jgi:transcriptional regulator with XRE-family HTH domain